MDIEKGLPWLASIAAVELDNRRIAAEAGDNADDTTLERRGTLESVTLLRDDLNERLLNDGILSSLLFSRVLTKHPNFAAKDERGEDILMVLQTVDDVTVWSRVLIAKLTDVIDHPDMAKDVPLLRDMCITLSKEAAILESRHLVRIY